MVGGNFAITEPFEGCHRHPSLVVLAFASIFNRSMQRGGPAFRENRSPIPIPQEAGIGLRESQAGF